MKAVKNIHKQKPAQAKSKIKNRSLSPNKAKGYFFPVTAFFLCLILYGNSISNDYTYDDKIYTYNNQYIVKGFSAIKEIFNQGSLNGVYQYNPGPQYRPLTLLNFMAEVAVFGLNPHVSHFFNVLFFAITVVLLYFFLVKILTQRHSPQKNYNHAIAIAATLLFAFHPIHTEVVDSIKSRDEIIGLLFGLVSFYFIILYADTNKKKYYFYSLAAFLIAIFCKENCLTFVLIIPLLLYFFTSQPIKKIAFKSIPYFGLAIFYLIVRNLVLHKLTFTNQIPIWDNALMAATNNNDMVATSFVLLGKYIYMCIIPFPLSWDYSYPQIPIVSWANWKAILSLLVCLALVVYMVIGLKKKSIFSFLIALFFITLFLSSNIVIKIAATYAERFLYTPSLSYCIALPILTSKIVELNPFQMIWEKPVKFYVPIVAVLAIFTMIVIPRSQVWKNEYTLFQSGVETSPNSGRTHGALGGLYRDSAQKNNDPHKKEFYNLLAIKEFKKASELTNMYTGYFYNLGLCYGDEGNQDSAFIAYKRAVELDPKSSYAATNLGLIYFNRAKYDSALHFFKMAYEADSGNLIAIMDIGATYENENKISMAIHYDSLVLLKDTHNKPTLNNLSTMYYNLASQYLKNNELDKSLNEFKLVLKCDSNSANALGNMGIIYQKMENIPMAKSYFQQALAKDPKNGIFAGDLKVLESRTK
jgi:protein O-mannosyl-transferase